MSYLTYQYDIAQVQRALNMTTDNTCGGSIDSCMTFMHDFRGVFIRLVRNIWNIQPFNE